MRARRRCGSLIGLPSSATVWKRKRRSDTKNRRVGKGALAPCPPSITDATLEWWARFALPTLRSKRASRFSITPRRRDGVQLIVAEHMRHEARRSKDFRECHIAD